jgi:MFS family permease
VAQTYLILFRLHGTGVDVAIATGLQFVPLLLFGPFGGLIADRLDKRKVLYATQSSAALLALAVGLLVITHSVHLGDVFALASLLGVVNLFDNPARQTFVSEMVGRDLLPNAVSLNSVVMNGARVIGPAIGGVLILTLGVSTCFIVNAASYVAVIVALSRMRSAELYSRPGVGRKKGQVREGLRYVWSTVDLRSPLISMAIVGIFAFNFTVTLPLLAKVTFHGGAGLYSSFLAAMGAGAVAGGLFTAHRSSPSTRLLAIIGLFFGGSILAVAVAPTRLVAILLLVLMGAGSISFVATNNATLQLRSDPAMRGRVMSLNAIAFLGSTPIGAPLVGYISDISNPRIALLVGGVATLMASVPLFFVATRQRADRAAALSDAIVVVSDEDSNVVPLPQADNERAPAQRRRTS